MTEKNAKPAIRFKDFTDTWEQRELGEIAVEVKRKADKNSIAPVMMISALDGFIEQSERYSTNNAGSSLKNYTLLYKGELAYNHGYSKSRNFGSVFDLKVKEARVPFVYHAFSLPEDCPNFFAYYLNSGLYDGELKRLVSSTARMDGLLNISFEDYMSIKILRPIKAEQQKIGKYFKNLDRLITLHQRKLEKLHNIKKSMLEKMFPKNGSDFPEIRFKGFTDAWEQRELGDISVKINKKNQDMVIDEVFTNSAEHGIISQRDYFDKDIASGENINGYYVVEPNDFVYNPRISNLAPFGPIKRNKLDKSGVMSPLYYVFKVKSIDYGYLEHFFSTNRWHSFMHLNGNTGARADRFAIRDEIFAKMPITIPQDIDEQKAIGDYFKSLDRLITLHQRKLEKLHNIKKSMLEKMFV